MRQRILQLSIKPRVSRLLLLALGVLFWSCAGAVEVKALYEIDVPVETRDRPERQEAFSSALAQVLVRITGDRAATEYPELGLMLEAASRYVQQFRYRQPEGGAAGYILRVIFDGPALERAIAERGLPVWGKERPAVLLWLAVQDRGRRYLVGEDSGKNARRVIDGVASERGVPLMYPLLDLEDQSRVSFADVSGGFQDNIREASGRYHPDAILVARAQALSGGYWRARWRMHFGEQAVEWETAGESLSAVLAEGTHRLAGSLAQRLATTGFAEFAAGTLVSVRGVQTFADHLQVSEYLSGLGPVVSSRSYAVAPGRADYLVEVRGDARDLERLISLSDLLAKEPPAPVPVIPPQGQVDLPPQPRYPTLHFRLIQ